MSTADPDRPDQQSAARPRWAELRLLPATLGAWAAGGVLIGVAPDAPIGLIAGVLWAAAVLAVWGAFRMRLLAGCALALIAAALVASVVTVRAPLHAPAEFRAAAGGAALSLELVVHSAVRDGRFSATAVRADDPDAGEVSILVFFEEAATWAVAPAEGVTPELRIGERWALDARLREVPPGDDIAFLAFVVGEPRRLAEAPVLLAAASGLREGLVSLSEKLPGPGALLLPGLAVGDTSRVDERLDAAMITSSLSHLTAVSGANCAVVVGIVFALCALLGLWRGMRVAVSVIALAGFVVLVTPEPSVLRAAVMAAIVLLALASGRPARGVPVLCLAVLVLLVLDPWLARSYGFALSALATAALLLLAVPLAGVLGRAMPQPLALVVAVPLAAQLACQPVLLLLSPTLPLWGVPANLLAGPAAPVATVLGLLACLCLPVLPPLAQVLAVLAWLPASWVAAVASFFAGLPGAQLPWPAGLAGILVFLVLAVLVLVAVLAPPGRLRRAAAVLALAGVLGSVGASTGIRLAQLVGRPGDWQYAMCDVGQGDALLIRSEGRIALVDTGAETELLQACLDELGVGAIELLVLTHDDHDHVGALEVVIGRVDTALVGPLADPGDERIRDELRAGGARVLQAQQGMSGSLGGLRWRALWPPPAGAEPGNAASIALLVEPGPDCAGCLSALLLGDLGEQPQDRMAALARIPRVDVLKVAHHGSGDFSERVYAVAGAAVGLVGVGEGNGYGHPTARALEALSASGTEVFRTDLDGLILVAPAATGPTAADAVPRVWTSRTP